MSANDPTIASSTQRIIDETRRWISSMVIGLNLCPFARRVFQADKIRYVVSTASEQESLLTALGDELDFLSKTPIATIETTILLHPFVLGDFRDYGDFLPFAAQLVKRRGLRGIIQIASFHPQYQFAGVDPDAIQNYTNRSPYPMLHLLREESISAITSDEDELLEIPKRNIRTLNNLGRQKILATLRAIKDDSRHSLNPDFLMPSQADRIAATDEHGGNAD